MQVLRTIFGEKREGKESILGREPQHFGIGSCSRLVVVRREQGHRPRERRLSGRSERVAVPRATELSEL